MTVYENIPQGTAEWNALRAGIPTASQAHRIITPGLKPCGKSVHDKYIFQLLAERLMLQPATEKPQTFWWAERGKELEKDAVLFYEAVNKVDTYPVTFVVSTNGRWGASPDRGVGEVGMSEYKCENEADHMMYVMADDGKAILYENHKLQVQFQLLTWEDREWDDLVAYHPTLPQVVHRSYREKAVQDALLANLVPFCDRLDALWEECLRRGYVDEVAEINAKKRKENQFGQKNVMDAMREALIESQKSA